MTSGRSTDNFVFFFLSLLMMAGCFSVFNSQFQRYYTCTTTAQPPPEGSGSIATSSNNTVVPEMGMVLHGP